MLLGGERAAGCNHGQRARQAWQHAAGPAPCRVPLARTARAPWLAALPPALACAGGVHLDREICRPFQLAGVKHLGRGNARRQAAAGLQLARVGGVADGHNVIACRGAARREGTPAIVRWRATAHRHPQKKSGPPRCSCAPARPGRRCLPHACKPHQTECAALLNNQPTHRLMRFPSQSMWRPPPGPTRPRISARPPRSAGSGRSRASARSSWRGCRVGRRTGSTGGRGVREAQGTRPCHAQHASPAAPPHAQCRLRLR